jgi:hypothetical protein
MSKIEQSNRVDLRHVASSPHVNGIYRWQELMGSRLDSQESASCWNHIRAPNLACFRSAGPDVRNAKAA